MNWFLRDPTREEGPFSEPEIRARLLSGAFSPKATVRQGDSAWRSATEVKDLFAKIYQNGYYVKTSGKTVGPFVREKIIRLHQVGNLPANAMLRLASSSEWRSVSETIELLAKQAKLAQELSKLQRKAKSHTRCSDEAIDGNIAESQNQVSESGEKASVLSRRPSPPERTVANRPVSHAKSIANSNSQRPSPHRPATSHPVTRSPDTELTANRLEPTVRSFNPSPPSLTTGRSAETTTPQATPYNPYQSLLETHAVAQRPSPQDDSTIWIWFGVIVAAALVYRISLFFAVAVLPPNLLLVTFVIPFLLWGALLVFLQFWGVFIAFQESASIGLIYLFVPFYFLYYQFTRWEACRSQVLITAACYLSFFILSPCLGALLVPFAVVYIVLFCTR